jgi:Universal stress protein family
MKAKPTNKAGAVTLELNRRDEPLLDAAMREAVKSPFTLKRILVPIDFSDCSKKALQYALPLAKEHAATLTLLYVVPSSYGAGEYGGIDYASLQMTMRVSLNWPGRKCGAKSQRTRSCRWVRQAGKSSNRPGVCLRTSLSSRPAGGPG